MIYFFLMQTERMIWWYKYKNSVKLGRQHFYDSLLLLGDGRQSWLLNLLCALINSSLDTVMSPWDNEATPFSELSSLDLETLVPLVGNNSCRDTSSLLIPVEISQLLQRRICSEIHLFKKSFFTSYKNFYGNIDSYLSWVAPHARQWLWK